MLFWVPSEGKTTEDGCRLSLLLQVLFAWVVVMLLARLLVVVVHTHKDTPVTLLYVPLLQLLLMLLILEGCNAGEVD